MPKVAPAPEENSQLEAKARFARVYAAANCRTQQELAEVLGIRQSSISDAKRRGNIPAEWLIKILTLRGVNPGWIQHGTGAKYLVPGESPSDASCSCETLSRVCACSTETVRKILHCFSDRDLAAELRRRNDNNYLPDEYIELGELCD